MIRDRGDYDFSDYQVETKTPIYVSVFLGVIFIAAAIIAIASSLALECPDGPKSCVIKSSKALFLGCEPYLDGNELELCEGPLIDGRPSSNCKLFCNRVYARQFPMYVGIATGFLSLAVTGYLCYKVCIFLFCLFLVLVLLLLDCASLFSFFFFAFCFCFCF
jgi:hypothetical protein